MNRTRRDNPHKAFVGNLSFSSTTESLRNYFSKYGDVADAYIPMSQETGKPRGFGFVSFGSAESLQKALSEPKEHIIDGRQIRIDSASNPSSNTSSPRSTPSPMDRNSTPDSRGNRFNAPFKPSTAPNSKSHIVFNDDDNKRDTIEAPSPKKAKNIKEPTHVTKEESESSSETESENNKNSSESETSSSEDENEENSGKSSSDKDSDSAESSDSESDDKNNIKSDLKTVSKKVEKDPKDSNTESSDSDTDSNDSETDSDDSDSDTGSESENESDTEDSSSESDSTSSEAKDKNELKINSIGKKGKDQKVISKPKSSSESSSSSDSSSSESSSESSSSSESETSSSSTSESEGDSSSDEESSSSDDSLNDKKKKDKAIKAKATNISTDKKKLEGPGIKRPREVDNLSSKKGTKQIHTMEESPKKPEPAKPMEASSPNAPSLVKMKDPGQKTKANSTFQRVDSNKVHVDPKLKSNSFLDKPGAIGSYGQKAFEDLSNTRGKDFRQEKNKKKKGSYKGGAIDTQVCSVKFDSD